MIACSPPIDSAPATGIDAALQLWRQGDLALDERWFVHIGDSSEPLTDASAEAVERGLLALTSEVVGLAIVTQTCDVVRECVARPYVEVAPLVKLSGDDFTAVLRGRRPALATLPALHAGNLAVDLDRVMTVESTRSTRAVAASWAEGRICSSCHG